MYAYYPLFVIAFFWLIFAVIQDIRKREISDWLNFSLLIIALGYRGIYSILSSAPEFFWYGFGGVMLFISFAYFLYYLRAFAGGDAKLLMGFGAIIPFESWQDYLFLGFGFIFVLFLLGSIYSLIYTAFLAIPKRKYFYKKFKEEIKKIKFLWILAIIFGLIFAILINKLGVLYSIIIFLLLFLFPILYSYARSVEKVCFIKLLDPSDLTEGDWIISDIKIDKKVIKKTIHGLTKEDIILLRKYKRKIMIKEGVPFAPAFLFTFLFMVFYVLVL